MTPALQIAVFLASVAIVIFVIYSLVALGHLRRQTEQALQTMNEMKCDMKRLMQDIHQASQTVSDLSAQARQQLDEVGQIVKTAKGWSERADRIVKQLDEAIEPPLATFVRSLQSVRKGVGAFLDYFDHKRKEGNHERTHR